MGSVDRVPAPEIERAILDALRGAYGIQPPPDPDGSACCSSVKACG